MKKSLLKKLIIKELHDLKQRDHNTPSNPLGVAVYNFEKNINGEEEANYLKEEIMGLTSIEEVVKYYLDERGWRDDSYLLEDLIYFIIELGRRNLINEIVDDEDLETLEDYDEKLEDVIDKKEKLKS